MGSWPDRWMALSVVIGMRVLKTLRIGGGRWRGGGGAATKQMLRRKKGTLRNTFISLWSELQWKTASNRSVFVEMTVKTLQDKKNGMLICLHSLLLRLQFFPEKHR